MADLFKLKGKVELDTGEFNGQVDDAKDKGRGLADSIGKSGGSIHSALQNAFSFSAGTLISEALKESWEFIKDTAVESINLASALEEVQNVVDVTFGDGASEVDRWAQAAKNAFGMSELKAKQFSGTMGAMLKSMGLTDKQVVEMATNLTGLAGDMASFYNLDHETAFEKIRSGISGETEPLKQLGINMSVASLNAFLLSQGITESYESMSQADQAMVRYNYLLSATKDAQGDFSRTSDSFANASRIFTENINSIKTQIGQALLPSVTDLLNSFNNLFFAEDNSLAAQFEKIDAEFRDKESGINATAERADALVTTLKNLEEGVVDTEDEQRQWAYTLNQLAALDIPGVTDKIDLQNMSIDGGTQALRENIQAWKDYSVEQARINAMQDTLNEYYKRVGDLSSIQVEMEVNQEILKGRLAEISDLFATVQEQTGITWDGTAEGLINIGNAAIMLASPDVYDAFYNWSQMNEEAIDAADKSEKAYAKANAEVEASKAVVEETTTALDNLTNAEKSAYEQSQDYMSALDAEIASMANVKNMADELRTAYDEMKKAARSQVESVVSGFKEMDNSTKTPVENVMKALTSQTNYMTEYSKNMQKAMDMGLDTGLINKLADGSEESAAILRGLTEASGTEADKLVAELNAAWAANQEAMDAMAESLATSHANASEEFQGLYNDLQQAIEELNQQDAAREAMESTLDGIDQAMKSKKDGLISTAQSIVDGLSATFSGMSLGFKIGGFRIGGVSIGSNAKGMDYVPYNNYLTYLHKGEKVMSAMEADRYRAGQMAQAQGIDYDRLASAVAGVLTGAVVQMDGRAVGELVAPTVSRSIQQGAWAGRYGK